MLDMHSSDDSMESFTTRDFLGGTAHNSGNSGSSMEKFTTQGFLGSTTARGLGRPYYTDGGTSRTEPPRCLDYTYSGGSDIELHAFIDEMNAEHMDELRQIALVQSTADGVDWSVEQLSAAKLVQADNKGVIIQEILCSSTDQRCIAVDSACITRRTRARSYDFLHRLSVLMQPATDGICHIQPPTHGLYNFQLMLSRRSTHSLAERQLHHQVAGDASGVFGDFS